eukprot:jgi/Mesen1/10655/ME000009S10448
MTAAPRATHESFLPPPPSLPPLPRGEEGQGSVPGSTSSSPPEAAAAGAAAAAAGGGGGTRPRGASPGGGGKSESAYTSGSEDTTTSLLCASSRGGGEGGGAAAGAGAGSEAQRQAQERRLAEKRKQKARDSGLTPAQVVKRRVNVVDPAWVPPVSPFGLVQEKLYRDPWRVLVACMLLNKTGGPAMCKVIWDLFDLIPTPEAAIAARTEAIAAVIHSLGLQNKRARMIQRFSREYARDDWTELTQLHGIGTYAADAHAIFCEGRWREVTPSDHMLLKYWEWLHVSSGQGYGFIEER